MGPSGWDYRDANGVETSIALGEGGFLIVPRGGEHRPVAENEAAVLLFEPAGTLNTGNLRGDRTVSEPQGLQPRSFGPRRHGRPEWPSYMP
jgi:hypothetical protein